jgi:ElaB/YqjD/DUF883 family membrane-anchored ribosome-binding protein
MDMAKTRKATGSVKEKKTRQKIKAEIKRRLQQAKKKIKWLEAQLKSPKNRARVKAEIEKAKKKLAVLKIKYKEQEKKALEYTQNNPKKALAVTAAIGVLAGTVIAAFLRRKK